MIHNYRFLLLSGAMMLAWPAFAGPLRVELVHERPDPHRSVDSKIVMNCTGAEASLEWGVRHGEEEKFRAAFNGVSYTQEMLGLIDDAIDTPHKEIVGASLFGCSRNGEGQALVEVMIVFRQNEADMSMLTETLWDFTAAGPKFREAANYVLLPKIDQNSE